MENCPHSAHARTDISKDYSVPVLGGPGDNDYARYMRTDALLALQPGKSREQDK